MPRAIHTLVAEVEREFGPVGAARLAEKIRCKARRLRILRECPTPGALAQRLVPTTVQTPMLNRIDEAILAADAGVHRRWIINTPPQEGKSTRIGRDAALWLLLRNPDRRIVVASYQQGLAEVSTLGVRRLVDMYGSRPGDPEENNLLGVAVERTPAAAGNWRIAGREGGMIAVGIGSGTTGRPGDVIVVDDPLADAEAADSPVQRRKVIDWWTSVIQTRLVSSSIVIVVQCIAEGQRVLTADGRWVPVEDVAPGDELAALDNTGKIVSRAVTAARCSGEDAVLTVRTDRLKLTVNGQHPFAVLPHRGVRCNPTDVRWVQARNLRAGDVVVTAKGAPATPREGRLPNGETVDLDRAWLLGYMLGDGRTTRVVHHNQNNAVSFAVCVATSAESVFGERVVKELARWSPTRVYSTGDGYVRTDWVAGGRVLHEMGYGLGARSKRVPGVVWSWPAAHRREFLIGYAAADGTKLLRCRDSWRVASANRDLIDEVRDLALTCGVRPGVPSKFTVTARCWTLSLAFAHDQAEGRSLITAPGHRDIQHVRYERVRSVTPTGRARVYDLTMSGSENFVAEGYVVHNTRWNEEDLSGWLIANDGSGTGRDAPRYEVLSIPAQAEANDPLGRSVGEWLLSARQRTDEEWEDTRSEVTKGGVRWWFALYQQRPAPPSGDTFKLEWFDRDRVWERPPGPPPVVVIDPADNTGSGDEAGIIVGSTDDRNQIYVGPDYSGYYTVGRWVRVALLAVARHKAGSLVYEQSLSGLARDVAYGWGQLHKQARILRRLGATPVIDPDIVEAAVGELCTPEDTDTTRGQYRAELLEVWSLIDAVLDYPHTGPSVRRIVPKGTKVWRAQAVSPRYEHRGVSHVGALPELEHQMTTWMPGQRSPDRMDACVHLVMLLSGATTATLSSPTGKGELQTRSTRNPSHRGGALPRSTMTRR